MGNDRSTKAACRGELKASGRRRSSEDTIGDIQRAAAEEFAALGFDCTTVEGIARKAKVSKQLLYYYFSNKAELYSLILEEAAVKSPEFEKNIDLDKLSAPCALTAFIETVFSDYESRPHIIQMTVDEAQHNFVHIGKQSSLAMTLRGVIELLDRILQSGVEAGDFRRGVDPDALFWTIFGLVTTWFAHAPMISRVSGPKLEGAAGLDLWRQNSTQFVLNSIAS